MRLIFWSTTFLLCATFALADLVFTDVPEVLYEGGKASIEVATRDPDERIATISLVALSGGGALTADRTIAHLFDGKAKFKIAITAVGLYQIVAEGQGSKAVADVRVVPEIQCTGALWSEPITCEQCVKGSFLNCVYCDALQACVDGGMFGARGNSSTVCPVYHAAVCWAPGRAVSIASVLGIALSLLACGMCVSCIIRRFLGARTSRGMGVRSETPRTIGRLVCVTAIRISEERSCHGNELLPADEKLERHRQHKGVARTSTYGTVEPSDWDTEDQAVDARRRLEDRYGAPRS